MCFDVGGWQGQLGALGTLALNLEKRHDRLRTMLSLLRTRPEIILSTPEGVDSMINLLDQQFQLLLADEHVKTGRRDRDDELDPSAKKGKGKDGKGKGKGKDSTSKAEKKECIVWKNTGKCKFGDRCRFVHGNPPAAPKSSPTPKPKASPASSSQPQECLAWKKNGKCRFGDKCKYAHVGDAKQAASQPQGPKAPSPGAPESLVGAKAKASACIVHPTISQAMKVLSGLEEPGPVPDPPSDSEDSRLSDASSEGNSGEEEAVDSIPDAGGPLWILDLTLRDYIHWTRPAQIQVCADRDFREEENPHAITWAVWEAIIHDELDTDESGTIPIAEDVCMIKCDTTVVFCEDGVGRPCFVVWIQEESTGRERHFALAQFRYRPRARRWPATPDPNVPERPLSNPQTPSKAAPARNPVAHDAVSASVGGVPPAKVPTVGPPPMLEGSNAVTSRSTDPQRTSSSTSSVSEQAQGYPRAAQACSTSVSDDERCVLADTGANELIRPAGVQPPMRSTKVHLTLADGNTTFAWRTRDGELAMPGEESSWIAPVGKLVELGYRFMWDLESGARLVRDTEAGPEIIRMFVDNGLPYICWSDFVYLRKQLSAAYRSSKKSCCAVDSGASKPVNQFMPPEDLQACESDHQESSAQGIKAGIGEAVAANFLKLERITYDNVLEAVTKAELKPQSRSRECAVGFGESKGVESWVFGAYRHGPKCGLTSRTTQYPNLVALINRFMKQGMPTATWSSFSVSRDVTFTPHRDLHNEHGSENILVVLNHKGQRKGGSLWIEHEDGDQVRQVKPDLSRLNGVVLPVLRHPVQFNPAKWHGTTPWKGSRTSLSFFTTKNAATLSDDEQRCLRELQFPTRATAAAVTMHDEIHSDPKPSLTPSAEDPEARTADATTGEFREFREYMCDGDQDGLFVGDDLQGLGNADGPPARSDQQILEDELAEYEPSFADPDDIFNERSGDVSIDGMKPLGSDVSCPGSEQGRRKEVAKDKPGHTLDDYKARGNKKPHRRVQLSDVAKGVLSIDIAGPYKGAYDDSGVFRLEDGATLQFVQPLQRRFWSDVLSGVRAILNELSAIAGGHAPVRIHSDRAKEFLARRIVEEIKGAGIHQTCTVGHDPAANSVAERNIGLLKQRVREFLIKGEAPSKYWPILFQEAAHQQRDLTLGKIMAGPGALPR